MSRTIQLPEEVYAAIAAYAARHGQTPEDAIQAWARALPKQEAAMPQTPAIYDPADDPLAEFLGIGELTDPEAIRQHDRVIAEEAANEHRGEYLCGYIRILTPPPMRQPGHC